MNNGPGRADLAQHLRGAISVLAPVVSKEKSACSNRAHRSSCRDTCEHEFGVVIATDSQGGPYFCEAHEHSAQRADGCQDHDKEYRGPDARRPGVEFLGFVSLLLQNRESLRAGEGAERQISLPACDAISANRRPTHRALRVRDLIVMTMTESIHP